MITQQPLRGVATISLFAADHAAARQWYTDFLGVEPYFARPGYVEFRIGDYQTELGIIDSNYIPRLKDAVPTPSGVITYWHVDDLVVTFQRLLDLGATQLDAPQQRGEGFITASVVDPFGNILGIMTNRHYMDVAASRNT